MAFHSLRQSDGKTERVYDKGSQGADGGSAAGTGLAQSFARGSQVTLKIQVILIFILRS
jgi:hypothetical protein